MTPETIELYIRLLTTFTIAAGGLVGSTLSAMLTKDRDEKRRHSLKLQLFRETCLYSILPIILTLVLNEAFLHDSSSLYTIAIAIILGLVGKPLTAWFSDLDNVLNLAKAIIFGAKGVQDKLRELNDLKKDLRDDSEENENK